VKIIAKVLSNIVILAALAFVLVRPALAQEPPDAVTPNPPQSPANRPARVVILLTKDFTFAPQMIHLKVNEKVELDVTGGTEELGVRVNPFPDGAKANTPPGLSFLFGEDCYKVKKGQMVPILIEATEPGTYTFSCCKACGSKHKNMTGKIVVDPAT
jgi:heme/copper-type cytochrome/quinol oxidase subunit 2